MPSLHQTALDPRGYTFQLPLLGLPEPSDQAFVVMRVGIGTEEACAALLRDPSTHAPLRTAKTEYNLMEVEFEGFIYFLPFMRAFYHWSKTEVFSVNVRRVPVKAMPKASSKRLKLDAPPLMLFLSPPEVQHQLEYWPALPDMKAALRHHSKLFNLCLDPTLFEHKPRTTVPRIAEDAEDPADYEERVERDKAWRRWAAMGIDAVNRNWLRQVYRKAVDAGLYKGPFAVSGDAPLIRLQARRAPNDEVTTIEFALCDEGDWAVMEGAMWPPLPVDAYSQDFVRCAVNLVRLECGKKLLTKAEWPPRCAAAGGASVREREGAREDQEVGTPLQVG